MSPTRLRRAVGSWWHWWDLAEVAFAGWLLVVLFGGPENVGRLTGLESMTPALQFVANWGFQAALTSVFVGFALLHLRQESGRAD